MGKDKRGKYFSSNFLEAQFIYEKEVSQVPGPGNYDPSIKQAKGKINPSWSLSKDARDRQFAQNSPGPGKYEIPSQIKDGPKYIMGLKPELNPFKNRTETGPGQYNPEKLHKKLQYSISKRNNTELSSEKLSPGPGTYGDIRESYYKSIPGSKVGRDNRQSSFLKTSSYDKPGPGKYATFSFTEKTDGPRFGFGSSTREKDYLG